MRLTGEETHRLVVLYGENECLWNHNHPNYRNKTLRETAECEIVEKFAKHGFGVNEFRHKMKNLRCTYNQECLKIKNSLSSGKGLDAIYVPGLKWFKTMDSYIKYVKRNRKHRFEVIEDINISNSIKVEDLEYSGEIITVFTPPIETPSEPKQCKLDYSTQSMEQNRDGCQKVECYGENSLNEHDAFASFVGASLKKLSTRDALMAQNEIQGILLKYRLNAETYNYRHDSPD